MVNFNAVNIFSKVSYILLCIQFVLAAIGVICNIMVILVFSRKTMRKYSYAFYCRVKACSDMVIIFYIYRNWFVFVLDLDLDIAVPFLCLVNRFNTHTASMFSLSILVIISLDRLISVMFPNRFGVLKKRWFQVLVLFVALVYSCGLNIILPLNMRYSETQVGNQTLKSCTLASTINLTHSWIRNINILVIILLINNAINIKLISHIVASNKKVTTNTQQNKGSRKERNMMISAIGLGFTALVCKLPLGTVTIINYYIGLPSDQSSMMSNVTITILPFEYSAMFVVNMLINSMFYAEFLSIFGFRSSLMISTTGNKRSKTNLTQNDDKQSNTEN